MFSKTQDMFRSWRYHSNDLHNFLIRNFFLEGRYFRWESSQLFTIYPIRHNCFQMQQNSIEEFPLNFVKAKVTPSYLQMFYS